MEKIIIFDFGSQYTQLIARRIREHNIYCEIIPYSQSIELDENCKGIILSGSPCSVNQTPLLDIELDKYISKIPLLAICYGAQLIAHKLGGKVSKSTHREYGRASMTITNQEEKIFKNIQVDSSVWMSHGDTIVELPSNSISIASTQNINNAAYRLLDSETYCLQFHPEVYHTVHGSEIIKNFLTDVCHCKGDWTEDSFIQSTIQDLKNTIGDNQVLMALSGGVDSTVAAVLLQKAIGNNLHCVFVDNGLLRKNEYEQVLNHYKELQLQIIGVNASETFYNALKNVEDPETKRKIIGKTFIDIFDIEAKKLQNIKYLAQGTIYPDVIESVSVLGPSVTIKSHHNVGGLPEKMNLKLVEPLRKLFKDEVRRIGKALGINETFLQRHPFPGPGLGIRILGDITPKKVKILQEADYIFMEHLKQSGLYTHIWQAGTILLNSRSVGVMGDERSYEQVIALRAVHSTDGMTADWVHLPYTLLAQISNDIINQVNGVNRVVYDISSKPPATIEWE